MQTDQFATVRQATGDILGYVSLSYGLVQNYEALDPFVQVFLDQGFAFNRAGLIDEGARIWMEFINAAMEINGDNVDTRIVIFNSHDGSLQMAMIPHTHRYVCTNLLASVGHTGFGFRHTRNVRNTIDDAAQRIAAAEDDLVDARKVFHAMGNLPITKEASLADYFEGVIPPLKKREDTSLKRNRWIGDFNQLRGNFYHGQGNTGDNLWHAYNAVTEWADHQRFRNYDDGKWAKTIFFNQGFKVKQQAYTIAKAMLKNKPLLN